MEGPGEGSTEGGRVKKGTHPPNDSIGKRTKLLLRVGDFGEDAREEGIEEGEEGLGQEGGGGDEEEFSSCFESGVSDSSVGVGEMTDDGGEETGEDGGFF